MLFTVLFFGRFVNQVLTKVWPYMQDVDSVHTEVSDFTHIFVETTTTFGLNFTNADISQT